MNVPIGELNVLGIGTCGGCQPHIELTVGNLQHASKVYQVVITQLKDVVDEHSQLMVEIFNSKGGVIEVALLKVALRRKTKKISLFKPKTRKK